MKETIEQIFKIYNESKNRILLYIQASVTPEQFQALRKLILDELGKSGAEGKVRKLLEKKEGQASVELSKKDGAL
jgi:hypothetical protein